MCGICFLLQPGESDTSQAEGAFVHVFDELKVMNTFRGPDAQDAVQTCEDGFKLTFFGSELRLRGHRYVCQPHRDLEGNVLCWNGEIFEGIEVYPDENDGLKLFSLLRSTKTVEQVLDHLGNIEGPYAIVFYHKQLRKVIFARDPLGRRSLLLHRPVSSQPRFLLASVSIGVHSAYSLEELSTQHVYCLDVTSLSQASDLVSGFQQSLQQLSRQDSDGTRPYAELARVDRTLPNDPPKAADLQHIPEHLSPAVEEFIAHLDHSVELRICSIPRDETRRDEARVAVLFSGGIDSTILAFLASRHVPLEEPIDLLNVAFENPRKVLVKSEGNIGSLSKRQKKQKPRDPPDNSLINADYDVPDRLTGLQELEELRRLCPGRVWNFVELNVPYEEYQNARPTVEALMFPRRTVMDLSLAMALYFAARGVGQVRRSHDGPTEPYISPARVLLNGLGSDELLGGYSRFRTAFLHGGWQAIIDELQLELDRLPTRNLGRDDRTISYHGKETRHPFLSLSVVSFLARLPVHMKVDPRSEAGLGEKLLLRLAAYKVGLVEASARKKRAMQFGSHSARMSPGDGDKKGDLLIPNSAVDVD